MRIKPPRRPAPAAKHRNVEIVSWPRFEIENDETEASVEAAEGIIGAEADAVETELSMTAGGSGAARVELDPLQDEIVIRIKETVTAIYPEDVAGTAMALEGGVLLLAQYPQAPAAPLAHDPQATPISAIGETASSPQVRLGTEPGIGLHHVIGNESDHPAETEKLGAVATVAGTIRLPPIIIPIPEIAANHAHLLQKDADTQTHRAAQGPRRVEIAVV